MKKKNCFGRINQEKMISKISLIIFTSLLISTFGLSSFVFPSQAEARYYVSAYQATGYWYGVASWNYVMSNPYVVSGSMKVNSIWCTRADGRAWTEIGWFAYDDRRPRFFCAWYHWSYYYEVLFEYPTPGTNHLFVTRWNGNYPTNTWLFYIDNRQRWAINISEPNGMSSAIDGSQAEKLSYWDDNYGHWWSLSKRDYYGNWSLWTNQQLWYDNDPRYYWYKKSNSEWYSLRG